MAARSFDVVVIGAGPGGYVAAIREVFHLMHRAKEFGLSADNISYDLDAVVKRSRKVAGQLSGGIGHLMKKNKVTVVMGAAREGQSDRDNR